MLTEQQSQTLIQQIDAPATVWGRLVELPCGNYRMEWSEDSPKD